MPSARRQRPTRSRSIPSDRSDQSRLRIHERSSHDDDVGLLTSDGAADVVEWRYHRGLHTGCLELGVEANRRFDVGQTNQDFHRTAGWLLVLVLVPGRRGALIC